MNLRMNRREKILLFIVITLLVGININNFVINSNDDKVIDLNDKKEKISKKENIKSNIKSIEEDIIFKIEKELNRFLSINSINKVSSWDEENNEEINIEINVSGTLENLFKIEDNIEILGLSKNLKDIKIIKNNVTETENNIDCTMLFKVG